MALAALQVWESRAIHYSDAVGCIFFMSVSFVFLSIFRFFLSVIRNNGSKDVVNGNWLSFLSVTRNNGSKDVSNGNCSNLFYLVRNNGSKDVGNGNCSKGNDNGNNVILLQLLLQLLLYCSPCC